MIQARPPGGKFKSETEAARPRHRRPPIFFRRRGRHRTRGGRL